MLNGAVFDLTQESLVSELRHHWCWKCPFACWVPSHYQVIVDLLMASMRSSNIHQRNIDDLYIVTHWGWVRHICVSKLTIIDSDNGLSPGRRQAIIWTNFEILLIGPSETNISEISIKIYTFPFKKSIGKWRLENGSHLVPASVC